MTMIKNETLVNRTNFFAKEFEENKENFVKTLKLDLQFFAEDPADPPADSTPPEDITLTQAELDKKIEAEADRKLAKALEKKQAEWQTQLDEKLAAERKTAEEYAKMTAKEKEDAAYKSRLSELEKREEELNKRQLLTQVEADLKENSLPISFAASLLTAGDNEDIKTAITAIKKDFDDAVNEAVKDKLRQDTPPAGNGGNKATNSIAKLRNEMDNKQNKAPDLWA